MGGNTASILSIPVPASSPTAAEPAFSPQAAVASLLSGPDGIAARLSPGEREELRSFGTESDTALFVQALHAFAGRLENADKVEAAARIYAAIAGSAPEISQLVPAQRRLDAILGKGAFGGRAEFLLRRFTQDATDPKMIVPMLAGTAVYGLARTAALGRLLQGAEGAWYSSGWGARFAASGLAFAAEVPTFALSSRALRRLGNDASGTEPGLGQELASAAITLGLLKGFSFAGDRAFAALHGANELGVAARFAGLTKFSRPLLAQGAMFTGLLAAHRVEEGIGLRPHVDGATTVTDTLASMFSLGIGARFGQALLGPRFAAFQAELQLRSGLALEAGKRPAVSGKFSRPAILGSNRLAPALGALAAFLPEKLAFAQEAGAAAAPDHTAAIMTVLSTLAVGGLLFWGGRTIRAHYVAPKGRITELQRYRTALETAKPEAVLKQVRKAETYLKQAGNYDRLNDEGIAVSAFQFLGEAIPRLAPKDRTARFRALWDYLSDPGPHNDHLALRIFRSSASQLDAEGRRELTDQALVGLRFKSLDRMFNAVFVLSTLLPHLEPAHRAEVVARIRDAVESRSQEITEHLQWVQRTKVYLKGLEGFMDRRLTEEKQKLRQRIRELKREENALHLLPDMLRERNIDRLEKQLENFQEDADSDILAAYEKHLADQGEDVVAMNPGILGPSNLQTGWFLDPALDYGDKLQEIFHDDPAPAPAIGARPPNIRTRLQGLQPYLKDGGLWISRLSPRSLLEQIQTLANERSQGYRTTRN